MSHSYLDKVLYHGLNLQAAIETGNESRIQSYFDKVNYFIAREQEVYGDQAMENLYSALTPEIIEALYTAEEIVENCNA